MILSGVNKSFTDDVIVYSSVGQYPSNVITFLSFKLLLYENNNNKSILAFGLSCSVFRPYSVLMGGLLCPLSLSCCLPVISVQAGWAQIYRPILKIYSKILLQANEYAQ